MTRVVLLRHGPTAWNVEGRIQGRTDTELSPAGRAVLAGRRVPDAFAGLPWTSSPLTRARQTADLLGARDVAIEPRLIEMHWGTYEGLTLADVRARYGVAMRENEGRGLDFRPDGGESPREVLDRLRSWLGDIGARRHATIAVTHKGVLRVALAFALGWDMTGRAPVKLDWARLHEFQVSADGHLTLVRRNIEFDAA